MPTTTPTRPTPPAVRRRHRAALFALLGVVALLALACGSSKKTTDAAGTTTTASGSSTTADDGYGYGSRSTTSTASGAPAGSGAATGSASVSVGTTSLGQVVVDQQGYTLYVFENDTGPTSTCVDACAKAWPAATVSGSPTAGAGVTGALTTTARADGSTQLVLAGHPLYRFAADGAPGDVMGQGIAGVWFAASPSGGTVK